MNSRDEQIRGQAAEFESCHERELKRIQGQLLHKKFEFDSSKAVLKDKKKRIAQGKNPRPIVIGTIKNRVVQRAILQVLQPTRVLDNKNPNSRVELLNDPRLFNINNVNRSKYGVGGLISPYGGVEPALSFALTAMDNGAKFVCRSDIKGFFDQIPVATVCSNLEEQIADPDFVELFKSALSVSIDNIDEVRDFLHIFPSDGRGVAQGSSLSSFAGNLLLYALDHEMNDSCVDFVRYVDDVLILGKTESDVNRAWNRLNEKLSAFGFSLYLPQKGSEKAFQGKCENSFDFLGCTLQPNRCVPSSKAVKSLISSVNAELSKSKNSIGRITSHNDASDAASLPARTLDTVGKRIYGWQKSFSFSTDKQAFRHIDREVEKSVLDYWSFVIRASSKFQPEQKRQLLGVPTISSMETKNLRKGER
ncbi:MAG: reverse transcriptase domain-containing protein [Pseudomonadota bacterium]